MKDWLEFWRATALLTFAVAVFAQYFSNSIISTIVCVLLLWAGMYVFARPFDISSELKEEAKKVAAENALKPKDENKIGAEVAESEAEGTGKTEAEPDESEKFIGDVSEQEEENEKGKQEGEVVAVEPTTA